MAIRGSIKDPIAVPGRHEVTGVQKLVGSGEEGWGGRSRQFGGEAVIKVHMPFVSNSFSSTIN